MSDTPNASKEAPKTSPAVENKPAPQQQQDQGDRKPDEKREQQK